MRLALLAQVVERFSMLMMRALIAELVSQAQVVQLVENVIT
jgi:hypothetical protein